MAKNKAFFGKDRHETAILIDPDKFEVSRIRSLEKSVNQWQPDYFFLGGSFLNRQFSGDLIGLLKQHFDLPVILFPGDLSQLVAGADAVMFLSLLSGRNPEYLAGQQVKAAPLIRQMKLHPVSVAYLLIESGRTTSVQYITQTLPLPPEKTDLIIATALAGQYMGMQAVYLEAGSGAKNPVPLATVKAVSEVLDIPLIVGGGIRDAGQISAYHNAGANVVVVGTAVEKNWYPG